jgi:polysaccharide pyruvyl transferase WcaK-like protein
VKAGKPARIGFFGLLGSGNIGNDASLEAVIRYLRQAHPDAELDAMCMGPETVHARYGLPAIPMQRSRCSTPGKALAKARDLARTAAWVRRHDAVIVPGMGVLEASLPVNPWGMPLALFVLSASGKLFRTRVALVSVGAAVVRRRATATLFTWTARLATYRSFRDERSRDALRRHGIEGPVYPDLAFGLEQPPGGSGDPQTVAVGVMAYYGGNDDRHRAAELHENYVTAMTEFCGWLTDNDYKVKVFAGDAVDAPVIDLVAARAHVEACPITTFAEVTDLISESGTVVATRFHNVLFALKLARPTISVSYHPKNDALMADMGQGDFCQPASAVSAELLVKQFTEVRTHSARIQQELQTTNTKRAVEVRSQFQELSRVVIR